VYIQRDGRDNISSMMDGWRHGRTDGDFHLSQFFGAFPEPVAINGGEFTDWAFFLAPGWQQYNHSSLEEVCAFQWLSANQLALDAKRSIPPEQWVQLRYEDIFERPVEMFQQAFERLDVPFGEAMRTRCANLRPTSIVKGNAHEAEVEGTQPRSGPAHPPLIRPLMLEMGYDPDD